MNEKVLLLKGQVKREKDYFYFLDKEGDISRAQMVHNGRKKKVQ